ncbi:hypothetical protein D0Z07_1104 [Hyphodiscus hymeniophilus]|uniref:Uncharacterized protein n=1 Tax=Hyphodiscus hymeniophilus TaxID=353542 RepID=A0A9P6VNT9_9HELO|nr:hypothetical protein D0Z07_1104 [Hyphodiscus hymeniophilus]
MSSCRNIKTRTVLGLATLATVQTSITARTTSSNSRSHIPVLSQNRSSSTVATQAQSSIPSRTAAPRVVASATKASSSMPKKTESSIVKHVERLRKTRESQAASKTATASKPKVAVSKPVQSRSAPGPRIPSTVSSSSSSSVARNDVSIDKHVKRITSAREKRSPATSPRPSPATSRKVSPLLITKKCAIVVDPAQVAERLSSLTVAPLRRKDTSPKVPTLRSCLKTVASAVDKHVRFEEIGGWNVHGLRAFQQDSAPNTFLSLAEATLSQPTPFEIRGDMLLEEGRPSRTKGLCHPGNYVLRGGRELRWPPPENDFPVKDCYLLPRCIACAQQAARGSPLTRYLPGPVSVRCSDCMSDPSKRLEFSPALDHNGEEDDLDTCDGEHRTDGSCHYGQYATKASVRWLYANYPERYPGLDDLLMG